MRKGNSIAGAAMRSNFRWSRSCGRSTASRENMCSRTRSTPRISMTPSDCWPTGANRDLSGRSPIGRSIRPTGPADCWPLHRGFRRRLGGYPRHSLRRHDRTGCGTGRRARHRSRQRAGRTSGFPASAEAPGARICHSSSGRRTLKTRVPAETREPCFSSPSKRFPGRRVFQTETCNPGKEGYTSS